ncbi:MAG: hypothetical protein KGQ42_09500, partial [Alphaproteobacteria bacterium]|nr:hypothetical protein [Alphaproteobacteria bacterium]
MIQARFAWLNAIGLALAVTGVMPLGAQTVGYPVVQPTDDYATHLRTLAHNPRDLNALIGAGQSALSVGDATAAINFFGRADTVSPNDGRVKAGLGSALLLLERPEDALRLFSEATVLGVPQSAIAVDRGLAYDLRGDQTSAQRDYAMAMQGGTPSDELRRRYALSLGISGRKNSALSVLYPLLQREDQAAWRDRAFILAMNGDVSGADYITKTVLPAQANAMDPFLRRLATLNPAQRARAVTYGEMPEDQLPGTPTTIAVAASTQAPAANTTYAQPSPVRVATTAPVPSVYSSGYTPYAPRQAVPASVPAAPPVSYATGVPAQPPALTHTQQLAQLAQKTGLDGQRVSLRRLPTPESAPRTALNTAPAVPVSTPLPQKQIVIPPPQPMEQVAAASQTVAPKSAAPVAVTAQPRFALSSLFDDMKMDPETPAVHVLSASEMHKAQLVERKQAKIEAAAKAKADAEAKAAAEEKAK